MKPLCIYSGQQVSIWEMDFQLSFESGRPLGSTWYSVGMRQGGSCTRTVVSRD